MWCIRPGKEDEDEAEVHPIGGGNSKMSSKMSLQWLHGEWLWSDGSSLANSPSWDFFSLSLSLLRLLLGRARRARRPGRRPLPGSL